MSLSIVCTGKPKDIDQIIHTAQVALTVVDEFLLCTSIGNLTDEDREKLQKAGIKPVETPEPEYWGRASVYVQMKDYKAGVLAAASDWILRYRTDMFINKQMLDYISMIPPRRKIWVPWADMMKPFYVADEVFLVHKSEAMKLHHQLPDVDELTSIGGETHIRRFVNPWRDLPFWQEYLKDLPDLCRNVPNRTDPRWQKYLREWVTTLYDSFHVFMWPGSITGRQPYWENDSNIDPTKWEENLTDPSRRIMHERLFFKDMDWINNLMNGRVEGYVAY